MIPPLQHAYAAMAGPASATLRSYWCDFEKHDRAFLEDWPPDATCFWWVVYHQGTDIGNDASLFNLRMAYFNVALFGSNAGARCFKWTADTGLCELTKTEALADITAECQRRYPAANAPAFYWKAGTTQWPQPAPSH